MRTEVSPALAPAYRWATAALTAGVPVLMGGCFLLLTLTFDYPRILSRPAEQVLAAAADMGEVQRLAWLGATWAAGGLGVLVVLLHRWVRPLAAGRAAGNFLPVFTLCGVVAALAMMLDLAQWATTYPWLGQIFVAADSREPAQSSALVTYGALHRLVGSGIGVYLATACSAIWAGGLGLIMAAGPLRRLGWAAGTAGLLFAASILPGVGFGGYSLLNSLGYAVWTLWLLGCALVLGRDSWPAAQ